MFLFTLFLQVLVTVWIASASKDGFVSMDFNLLKGKNLQQAFDNLFNSLKIPSNNNGASENGNSTDPVKLENEKLFYVSKVKIGSQKNEVEVLIDTGSSDLWVMSSENPHCEDNGGKIDCKQYGTFNQNTSSTFENNGTSFNITYEDNTYARGSWGTDTISIGDNLELKNASFAVANDSTSNVGVFGIGFIGLESSEKQYRNVPQLMKDQGFIKKVAYSLYITSAESNSGSIIFGGVDHAKYSGDLKSLKIQPTNDAYKRVQVQLDSIKLDVSSGNSNSSKNNTNVDVNNPAIIDSGTTLTALPPKMFEQVAQGVGANISEYSENGLQVPCSLRSQNNYVTFKFQEKDIKADLSNFVELSESTGSPTCTLGFLPSQQLILGDNFLRSCYTVINLEDKTASIAQMKYTDDKDISVID